MVGDEKKGGYEEETSTLQDWNIANIEIKRAIELLLLHSVESGEDTVSSSIIGQKDLDLCKVLG